MTPLLLRWIRLATSFFVQVPKRGETRRAPFSSIPLGAPALECEQDSRAGDDHARSVQAELRGAAGVG